RFRQRAYRDGPVVDAVEILTNPVDMLRGERERIRRRKNGFTGRGHAANAAFYLFEPPGLLTQVVFGVGSADVLIAKVLGVVYVAGGRQNSGRGVVLGLVRREMHALVLHLHMASEMVEVAVAVLGIRLHIHRLIGSGRQRLVL